MKWQGQLGLCELARPSQEGGGACVRAPPPPPSLAPSPTSVLGAGSHSTLYKMAGPAREEWVLWAPPVLELADAQMLAILFAKNWLGQLGQLAQSFQRRQTKHPCCII